MDNIGDWLYLVFIIIAAVSSIFSTGKKKNQSKEILGQPGRDIIISDRPSKKKVSRIEVVSKKEQKQNKKPQVRASQPAHPQPTPFLREDYVPNLYDRPIEVTVSTEMEREPEETGTPAFELNSADDLKKAVIYTEILNRKY